MNAKPARFSVPRTQKKRAGAVVVEAALIMPMVVLVTLGSIDIAQYINLAQIVTNSSREAARVASRHSTLTVAQVEASVESYVAATFPNMTAQEVSSVVAVEIRDKNNARISTNLTQVNSGDEMVIEVSFDYSQIRWIPGPDYFNGNTNRSVTTCRRE